MHFHSQGIITENALRCATPATKNFINYKVTLDHEVAWCHQAVKRHISELTQIYYAIWCH